MIEDNITNVPKKILRQWFASMDQCSVETGISKPHLRIAKKFNAPGFDQAGRIDWVEFEPWWEANKEEVLEVDEDTLHQWKTRKTKAEALTAEIELEEMRQRSLDREEVRAYINQIASAQKALLRSTLCNELPSKLLGLGVTEMSVVMNNTVEEICKLMQNIKL